MFLANYLDLSAFGILLFSIGMGFYRGLIWELLKYVAFVISVVVTVFALFKLFPFFESSSMEETFWYLLCIGATIFISTSVCSLYIVQKISKLIRKTYFAWTDKVLGSIFGGIRACVFVLLLYSGLMIITMNQKPEWMQDSALIVPLDSGNHLIQKMLLKLGNDKILKLLKLNDLTNNSINKNAATNIKHVVQNVANNVMNNGAQNDSAEISHEGANKLHNKAQDNNTQDSNIEDSNTKDNNAKDSKKTAKDSINIEDLDTSMQNKTTSAKNHTTDENVVAEKENSIVDILKDKAQKVISALQ